MKMKPKKAKSEPKSEPKKKPKFEVVKKLSPKEIMDDLKNQLKKGEPIKKSKIKPRKNSFIPSVQEIRKMLKLIKNKSRSKK